MIWLSGESAEKYLSVKLNCRESFHWWLWHHRTALQCLRYSVVSNQQGCAAVSHGCGYTYKSSCFHSSSRDSHLSLVLCLSILAFLRNNNNKKRVTELVTLFNRCRQSEAKPWKVQWTSETAFSCTRVVVARVLLYTDSFWCIILNTKTFWSPWYIFVLL